MECVWCNGFIPGMEWSVSRAMNVFYDWTRGRFIALKWNSYKKQNYYCKSYLIFRNFWRLQRTHPCVVFLPGICSCHRFYAIHHHQWQPRGVGREVGMVEDLELMGGRVGREGGRRGGEGRGVVDGSLASTARVPADQTLEVFSENLKRICHRASRALDVRKTRRITTEPQQC